MAATVKVESESADNIDPLSSNNENEMLEVKHEKYLLPVVMPESEVGFVCSSFLSVIHFTSMLVCLFT
jgi:hypothetical protein